MPEFTVSVTDIAGRTGHYKDIHLSGLLTGVGTALARLPDDAAVTVDGRIESVMEGLLVTASARAPGTMTCARCLKELTGEVATELCELFVAPDHPDAQDNYIFKGEQLHLEPLVRDAMGLALPLNPVCGPECRGLCAGCGRDLNLEACNCSDEEIDPRWAGLADLRARLEAKG